MAHTAIAELEKKLLQYRQKQHKLQSALKYVSDLFILMCRESGYSQIDRWSSFYLCTPGHLTNK